MIGHRPLNNGVTFLNDLTSNRTKVKILFAAIICSQVVSGFGQDRFLRLDSVLTVLGREEMFHGQVLAIERNDVKFAEAYGVRAGGKRYSLDQPIEIHSVTKMFTALAIMILAEDGKLKLEDPITKFFPSLPYEGVTISHLLTHSSGLPLFFQTVFDNWPHDQLLTNSDLVELIETHHPKPVFKPGEREQYNQTGYMLLGSIVEKGSGIKYEQFLRKRIFEPAGMTSTFHLMEDEVKVKTMGVINIDNLFNAMRGDGNMFSTATDLGKLDRALSMELIVSKATLQKAYVAPTSSNGKKGRYGFGCSLLKAEDDSRVIQHMGQGPTVNAVFTRFIDTQSAVVVLHAESVQYAYPVYNTIMNIIGDRPFTMPVKRIAHSIDPRLLEKYTGNYGENGYMHLTVEDGKLFIQPDGNPGKMEIVPSSDTTFYFKDQAVDWQIYLDKKGEVIGFGPLGEPKEMMIRKD
jgi:CubicO group peptidase (beta-lactamase class C family)